MNDDASSCPRCGHPRSSTPRDGTPERTPPEPAESSPDDIAPPEPTESRPDDIAPPAPTREWESPEPAQPYVAPVPERIAVAAPAARRTDSLAVTALLLSGLGLLTCGLTSFLGIVFGNQALDRAQTDPAAQGEGVARAAIALGFVSLAAIAVPLVVWVLMRTLTLV
ncbi:MAG TPA: DUF4190 domain-containing protein [Actinomycetota bacterium]|nr:DUF4190 domain-containing protein [Actinomycetota bacterium]